MRLGWPRSTLRRQLPERRRGPVCFGRLGSWAVPLPGWAGTDAGAALGRMAVGHHCQPECRAWRQLPRVGGGGISARRVGGRLPRRQGGLSIAGGALGWRSLDCRAAAAARRPGQRAECGGRGRFRRRVGGGWIGQGARPISATGPSTPWTELVFCPRSREPSQRHVERGRRKMSGRSEARSTAAGTSRWSSTAPTGGGRAFQPLAPPATTVV